MPTDEPVGTVLLRLDRAPLDEPSGTVARPLRSSARTGSISTSRRAHSEHGLLTARQLRLVKLDAAPPPPLVIDGDLMRQTDALSAHAATAGASARASPSLQTAIGVTAAAAASPCPSSMRDQRAGGARQHWSCSSPPRSAPGLGRLHA